MNREILLAQPRGFCAGVCRAIEIVESALAKFGAPIYIRHEIVHNTHVVENLRKKGAIFIEELDEVPAGSTLIFSAHGVPKSVREQAEKRGLTVFDATCPLVTKVHAEVMKMHKEGREIIIIGHRGHPEVEGTMGQIENGITLIQNTEEIENIKFENPDKLAYVTQTTLSLDDSAEIIAALKERFPNILGPKKSDICFATTNRQEAVKIMAKQVDMVLVVGSRNSSNSNRLREVAEKNGAFARMVDNAAEIQEEWLKDKKRIGITAGASAPEILVNEVIDFLKERSICEIKVLDGITENTSFPLPKGLI